MAKKSKSNFLSWLVVVLILVVILGTAYWYYIKFVQPTGLTTLVPSPSNTFQASPIPSVSTPADWKTFNNATYKYSLKYPPTFINRGTDKTVGFFEAPNNQIEGTVVLDIEVDTQDNDLNKTLAQILEERKSKSQVKDCRTTKLDGVDAYECVGLGLLDYYEIYAKDNGHLYQLIFGIKNTANDTLNSLKNSLSQTQTLMLASFQFTH